MHPRHDELVDFYANPLDHRMLRIDGVAVAVGMVVQDERGQKWGFLTVKPDRIDGCGITLVRVIRRYLEWVGGPVHVLQQSEYETSARLLRLLGFVETTVITEQGKVWTWQSLQH